MNNRIIHTNLFSNKAKEILSSVIGNWSDGKWENCPRMEKYWQFVNVETADNGEVLLAINTEKCRGYGDRHRYLENAFFSMSDEEVKDCFARYIKTLIRDEMKDNDKVPSCEWRRDNTSFKTRYLSYDEDISTAEVYFIYEQLHGRDCMKKYAPEIVKSIMGEKHSDEETAKIHLQREEHAKREAKYVADRKSVDSWEAEQIALIKKQAEEKRSKLYADFRNSSK